MAAEIKRFKLDDDTRAKPLLEAARETPVIVEMNGNAYRVSIEESTTDVDPTIALLESWIAQAPTDREAIREAEEDLRAFKRDMNRPRKETGARLHYPETE